MKQESQSALIRGKEARAPSGSPICSIYLAVKRWISGTFCKKHLDKSPRLTSNIIIYGVRRNQLYNLVLEHCVLFLITLLKIQVFLASNFIHKQILEILVQNLSRQQQIYKLNHQKQQYTQCNPTTTNHQKLGKKTSTRII